MSLSLSNVEQIEFDALVKAAYESAGQNLRNTIRVRTGFVGKFVDFRKVGFVISVKQAFQDSVSPQDPQYTKVTMEVDKFVTPVLTDIVQNLTVNFDDRAENASLVAMAVNRRHDQLIIDAAAVAILPAFNVIPDGGVGMTYAKVRQVNKIFNTNNVPDADRHFWISPDAEQDLLNEPQFTDNDFVNKGAVRTGTLNNAFAMGMTFHVIGNRPEGGLPFLDPPTNLIRRNFAYAGGNVSSALGFGMNKDFGTRIDYLPKETSWLVNGIHSSGAVAIDVEGIIDVQTVIV